jgi:type I restriction enzyme, S subunit
MTTDEWREASLGEVCRIRIGRTPPRKEARYWTQDLERPFCTIADMTERRINPIREGVTQVAESDGKAKRVPAGSLLMSFKLTIGRVGFAARDLFPNEAIAWLKPVDPELDQDYLALWLEGQDLSEGSGRAVKGSTLNSDSLRSIRVEVPPLDVQRRIVDLIGAVDANLDRLRQETGTLKALRTVLLNDLLKREVEIPESYDQLVDAGVV